MGISVADKHLNWLILLIQGKNAYLHFNILEEFGLFSPCWIEWVSAAKSVRCSIAGTGAPTGALEDNDSDQSQ